MNYTPLENSIEKAKKDVEIAKSRFLSITNEEMDTMFFAQNAISSLLDILKARSELSALENVKREYEGIEKQKVDNAQEVKDNLFHVNKIAELYGFRTRIFFNEKKVLVKAMNVAGEFVDWFAYYANLDAYHPYGDTAKLNLWLHKTRPELTADELAAMFIRLDVAMSSFISPDDWKEIAHISDISLDKRYTVSTEESED